MSVNMMGGRYSNGEVSEGSLLESYVQYMFVYVWLHTFLLPGVGETDSSVGEEAGENIKHCRVVLVQGLVEHSYAMVGTKGLNTGVKLAEA